MARKGQVRHGTAGKRTRNDKNNGRTKVIQPQAQTAGLARAKSGGKAKGKAPSATPKVDQRRKMEAIKQRMGELAESHGGTLTPEVVVEDARNPSSPLHGEFEWNTAKAAYAHWIDRARTLIRTIRYTVKTEDRQYRVPQYVRDPRAASKAQGYIAVPREEKDYAKEFLVEEIDRALAALHRALAYASDTKHRVIAKALSSAIAILTPFASRATEKGDAA